MTDKKLSAAEWKAVAFRESERHMAVRNRAIELEEALIEIRDRCARVAEARAVARRVLGNG